MQMVCSGATSEFTVFCVSMFASVLLHVCFCLSAENVSVCVCARLSAGSWVHSSVFEDDR